MRSLGMRLIVGTLAAMLAVSAGASVVLYVVIRRSMAAEFDGGLAAKARALAAMTEQDGKRVRLEVDPKQFDVMLDHEAFILRGADGKIVARAGALAAADLEKLPAVAATGDAFADATLAAGEVRYVATAFSPRVDDEDDGKHRAAAQQVTLVVMRETAGLKARLARVAWIIGGVFGGMMLITAGVMAWVIGRGLRPLERLAQRIDAIGDDDLGVRVESAGSPAEMEPVVQRLNELLARLEGAFGRERQFTADVAHELRTPLAGLQAALEVCASQKRSAEDYEQVVGRCLKVTRGMRQMVENLLTLARVEARLIRPARAEVELPALLTDVWQEFRNIVRAKELRVEWGVEGAILLETDRSLLTIVLRNLFANATAYCDQAGMIAVAAAVRGGRAEATIRNSGSQVAGVDAEKVFERFWRGDAARTAGEHCGVGLSLCRRVLEVLGGTITVETRRGGDFCVAVSLPDAGEAAVKADSAGRKEVCTPGG